MHWWKKEMEGDKTWLKKGANVEIIDNKGQITEEKVEERLQKPLKD